MVIQYEWGTPMYDQSIYLRNQILRKPLNMTFKIEELVKETNAYHFGIVDNNQNLLACMFLLPENKTSMRLKQMGVKQELQKIGLGKLLMVEAENFSKGLGFKNIILHAREEAVGFYEKLDYQIIGDKFSEINIPHYKMKKKIKKNTKNILKYFAI